MSLTSMNIERHAAPLRKQVVDEIRRAIVSNSYPPGSRLVERILCEQMQVSRTVVREALRQLEAEQLIEMVPNVGSVVRHLSLDEVRSLYEVRAALESLAAARSAERADDALIARLKSALDGVPPMGSPIQDRIVAQDAFTDVLIEGAGNVVVGDMLDTIHSRVSRLRTLTLMVGGPDRLIPGLTRIYTAVAAHDAESAEQQTREFVHNAAEIALESLSAESAATAESR